MTDKRIKIKDLDAEKRNNCSNSNDESKKSKRSRKSSTKIESSSTNTSATSAKFSILFQLVSRILTFAMNNLITRSTSASYLGIVAIRLDLILTTISSLSRDGIRMALLRQTKKGAESRSAAWVTIVMSVLIGMIVCSVASFFIPEEFVTTADQFEYKKVIWMYFAASVIESGIEGPLIRLILTSRFKMRVFIESAALMSKVLLIIFKLKSGVVVDLNGFIKIFAMAQLTHAVILNALYWTLAPVKPLLRPTSEFISLASALMKQSFFKFFLSQGDMIVVSSFSSLNDQGVYAVVSNYGSLILRMLMQPIEESSLHYFSKELNSKDWDNGGKSNLDAIFNYFCAMLKTMIYLALFFISFGPFFTNPLIFILLGRKWSEETTVPESLSAYCFLVASAGISGFLEAFVHSIITEEWMRWQRIISIISSIFYCSLAIVLIRFKGSLGLISASAINFFLRALVNAYISQNYWKLSTDLWRPEKASIRKNIIFSFLASFAINLCAYYKYPERWIERITLGSVLFAISIGIIYKYDAKFINQFYLIWFK